jgi:transposase
MKGVCKKMKISCDFVKKIMKKDLPEGKPLFECYS